MATAYDETQEACAELHTVLCNLYAQTWYPDTINPWSGICPEVTGALSSETACEVWRACCRDFFETWEYFSGDMQFPVPAPGGASPGDYYVYADSLWHGRQRMMRRSLLRHILKSAVFAHLCPRPLALPG